MVPVATDMAGTSTVPFEWKVPTSKAPVPLFQAVTYPPPESAAVLGADSESAAVAATSWVTMGFPAPL